MLAIRFEPDSRARGSAVLRGLVTYTGLATKLGHVYIVDEADAAQVHDALAAAAVPYRFKQASAFRRVDLEDPQGWCYHEAARQVPVSAASADG